MPDGATLYDYVLEPGAGRYGESGDETIMYDCAAGSRGGLDAGECGPDGEGAIVDRERVKAA